MELFWGSNYWRYFTISVNRIKTRFLLNGFDSWNYFWGRNIGVISQSKRFYPRPYDIFNHQSKQKVPTVNHMNGQRTDFLFKNASIPFQ